MGKYEQLSGENWDDMKEDLLHVFGRQESFELEAKLLLIQSLTKGDNETFKNFMFRIQWVIMNIVDDKNIQFWIQVFFLLGLQEADQKYVLEKFKENQMDSISHVVESLDSAYFMTQVKVEQCESENDYEPDNAMDLDYEPPMSGIVKEEHEEEQKKNGSFKIKLKRKKKSSEVVSCKICEETFKGPKWLANHMKQKHPQSIKCNACEILVENTAEAWDKHETDNHLHSCIICTEGFDGISLELMRDHHKQVHDGKEMRCQKC